MSSRRLGDQRLVWPSYRIGLSSESPKLAICFLFVIALPNGKAAGTGYAVGAASNTAKPSHSKRETTQLDAEATPERVKARYRRALEDKRLVREDDEPWSYQKHPRAPVFSHSP
jgi:hypothetical protein